jgi:uncharacterized phage-like protein YoqJ
MKIAITGHRPDSFLISHYSPDTIIRLADNMVCVFKREFKDELFFNLGGAVGADQWVGKACIEHNVSYKLYLPFHPSIQARYWNSEQKQELDRQMRYASGINIIEPNPDAKYQPYLYQERNKKMVDDSNFVVAFWMGKRRGGTFNAMQYALKQSKFVFNALDKNRPLFKEDLKKGWNPSEGKDE